jgi:hypothetical protein
MAQKKDTLPPIDVQKILDLTDQIRKAFWQAHPDKKTPPPRKPAEGLGEDDLKYFGPAADEETMREFDYVTAAEALRAVSDEMHEELERQNKKLLDQAMKVYYTMVEMAKDDPKTAKELAPHIKSMREAYFRDFGKEIPETPPEGWDNDEFKGKKKKKKR